MTDINDIITKVNQLCEAVGIEGETENMGCTEQLDAIGDKVGALLVENESRGHRIDVLTINNERYRTHIEAQGETIRRHKARLKDMNERCNDLQEQVRALNAENVQLIKWNAKRGQTIKRLNDRISDLKAKLHIAHETIVRNEREAVEAPVLAADGKPLVVSDTVWCGSKRLEVVGVGDGCVWAYDEDGVGERYAAVLLTHEFHDSWERLAEDVDTGDLFGEMDVEEVAHEVLCRAKALAGVER